jgi:hypothetical protein
MVAKGNDAAAACLLLCYTMETDLVKQVLFGVFKNEKDLRSDPPKFCQRANF